MHGIAAHNFVQSGLLLIQLRLLLCQCLIESEIVHSGEHLPGLDPVAYLDVDLL
ncbi:MAG TPA: hypothetical protein VGD73_10230 [Pseudonocardia sp.]|uniref:hypothetical protein n=1 Tax=Pseudonocardia sp. TaxID=60912 RepID=UPI002EDB188D